MTDVEIAARAHEIAASGLCHGLPGLPAVRDDRRELLKNRNATAEFMSGCGGEPIQSLAGLLYGAGTTPAKWLEMSVYRALLVQSADLGDASQAVKDAFITKLESEAAVAQLVAMSNGW